MDLERDWDLDGVLEKDLDGVLEMGAVDKSSGRKRLQKLLPLAFHWKD